jgi:uncharacterized protein (TIGR03435 family)
MQRIFSTRRFPIAAVAALVGVLSAQTPDKFEVASIHRLPAPRLNYDIQGQRLLLSSMVFGWIVVGYRVIGCGWIGQLRDCPAVVGGPDWMRQDFYVLQALLPEDVTNLDLTSLFSGKAPRVERMLQAMLADRFQLKVHQETREQPVFTLTVAKGGAKLQPSKGDLKTGMANGTVRLPNGTRNNTRRELTVQNSTMQQLAEMLSTTMLRPVLNQTDLEGAYDFVIQFDRDDVSENPYANDFGPSMIKAFERELGLKLEATKAPVPVLVIDQIERPSEN